MLIAASLALVLALVQTPLISYYQLVPSRSTPTEGSRISCHLVRLNRVYGFLCAPGSFF
jgi:hypothetical protein